MYWVGKLRPPPGDRSLTWVLGWLGLTHPAEPPQALTPRNLTVTGLTIVLQLCGAGNLVICRVATHEFNALVCHWSDFSVAEWYFWLWQQAEILSTLHHDDTNSLIGKTGGWVILAAQCVFQLLSRFSGRLEELEWKDDLLLFKGVETLGFVLIHSYQQALCYISLMWNEQWD